MNRRAVIVGVLLVPMTALSQQTFRLALVSPTTPATDMNEAGSPIFGALLLTLRELGYSEGQNLVVGRYSRQGALSVPFRPRDNSFQARSDFRRFGPPSASVEGGD